MTIHGCADMEAICEVPQSGQRLVYRVAGQTVEVDARDVWAAEATEKLFAGLYLNSETLASPKQPAQTIVIQSTTSPPLIPQDWQQFNIAGGGVCSTDGNAYYIDIEGSIVAIGVPGFAAVEVWANGPLDFQSESLTRLVTYSLAAVLRRRGLFELHSGAVVEPESGTGVLIIGPSGSGKSTLTVQLAAAGWPFLTDDVLVLSNEGSAVLAWPLRRCFAITSETFASSDFLRSRTNLDYAKAQGADKKRFAPHEVFGAEVREHCAPRALFFSQISGEERTHISKLSPGETMTRLIRMNPWSCYDQTTATNHLAVLSALVKQSQGYALFAAKDLLDPDNAARLIGDCTRNELK